MMMTATEQLAIFLPLHLVLTLLAARTFVRRAAYPLIFGVPILQCAVEIWTAELPTITAADLVQVLALAAYAAFYLVIHRRLRGSERLQWAGFAAASSTSLVLAATRHWRTRAFFNMGIHCAVAASLDAAAVLARRSARIFHEAPRVSSVAYQAACPPSPASGRGAACDPRPRLLRDGHLRRLPAIPPLERKAPIYLPETGSTC